MGIIPFGAHSDFVLHFVAFSRGWCIAHYQIVTPEHLVLPKLHPIRHLSAFNMQYNMKNVIKRKLKNVSFWKDEMKSRLNLFLPVELKTPLLLN